jgi:hypothetical protein
MRGSPFKPPTTTQGSISKIDSLIINRNKYTGDKSSSAMTAERKAIAIGRNNARIGINHDLAISYANINANDVKTALTKVRGGGSVAPAKKGFMSDIKKY